MDRISVVIFTTALGYGHNWNGYNVVVLWHKISVYSYGFPYTKMQNTGAQLWYEIVHVIFPRSQT